VKRHKGHLALASVLWDARGIIFIDNFENSQIINSEYYMALLEHLNDEIKEKTAPFEELIAVSSRLCHKSIKTTAKLHELGYELLLHPPFSPDLSPTAFFLFADLKRMLAGKNFSTNETEAYFEPISKSYTIKIVSPSKGSFLNNKTESYQKIVFYYVPKPSNFSAHEKFKTQFF
jgi:hypothetical protein